MSGKTVTFSGGGAQTITASGALGGTEVINKSSGILTVATGTSIYLGDSPTSTISLAISAAGGLTNNGTITVNSGVWNVVATYGNTFFTNNGTITHNGSGWNFTGNTGNGFINSVGAVVTYAGTTLTTVASFTNSGTFTASSLTSVTIGGNFTQSGTYTTNANVTTTFNGGIASTITVNGALSGIVIINKDSTGSGYNITTTIATSTIINLGNNANTTLSSYSNGKYGHLTNNGTIIVGTGTWTVTGGSTIYGSANFVNNGTITNSSSAWVINYMHLTNNTGATITYQGTSLTLNGSFTQNGTFDLTGKTITFGPTVNSNTLVTCSVNGGVLGGTVVISRTAPMPVNPIFTIATGTTINLGNSPTSDIGTGYGYAWTGSIINNGTILVGTGTWTIIGHSDATWGGTRNMSSLINNGIITISGSVLDINKLDFTNNGTITASSVSTIGVEGNFTQSGTFDLTNKIITFDGAYDATATIPTFSGSLILAKSAANNLTLANDITVINATTTSGILANPASP
ncbi:MAG: hypothetical protein WCK10_03935, partial [Candidatus Staskawiczbacteria bacterium]